MTVIALTNSIPFGILEMLSELGRHNKNSQLQAIRTKRLHTLYELNYIYCKSAFNATVIPFLNNCETSKVEPSVEKLYKFVEKSPNLLYQARFRALLSLNIPCIVKGRVQLKKILKVMEFSIQILPPTPLRWEKKRFISTFFFYVYYHQIWREL